MDETPGGALSTGSHTEAGNATSIDETVQILRFGESGYQVSALPPRGSDVSASGTGKTDETEQADGGFLLPEVSRRSKTLSCSDVAGIRTENS